MNQSSYIKEVQEFEQDGPVSVTLVVLHDGRVLGINDECVVLYQSMADFNDAETVDRQCIDLTAQPAPMFTTEGGECSIDALLDANRDDEEICTWARTAQVGEEINLGGGAAGDCIIKRIA